MADLYAQDGQKMVIAYTGYDSMYDPTTKTVVSDVVKPLEMDVRHPLAAYHFDN